MGKRNFILAPNKFKQLEGIYSYERNKSLKIFTNGSYTTIQKIFSKDGKMRRVVYNIWIFGSFSSLCLKDISFIIRIRSKKLVYDLLFEPNDDKFY